MAILDNMGSEEPSCCPIGQCAEILSGKWTLLLIRDLASGPRYYGDLEQSLKGISPRTLCERLRFLAERGFVTRTYIKALPPRTQYELTEMGQALIPVLDTMRSFARSWLSSPVAAQPDDVSACDRTAKPA